MEQIEHTLEAVRAVGMQTVWLWPNVDAGSDDVAKGIRVFRETRRFDRLHLYRNFGVEDYLRVLNGASCIVGNSSSGIREGGFLGVPAVSIGSRQNGRERGKNVRDVAYDSGEIEGAIRDQVAHGRYAPSTLYGDGRAGARIADVLAEVDLSVQKQLHYQ